MYLNNIISIKSIVFKVCKQEYINIRSLPVIEVRYGTAQFALGANCHIN